MSECYGSIDHEVVSEENIHLRGTNTRLRKVIRDVITYLALSKYEADHIVADKLRAALEEEE